MSRLTRLGSKKKARVDVFKVDLLLVCNNTLAPNHGWTPDQVEVLVEELHRALRIKSLSNDPFELSLPPRLDACWHEIILETKLYSEYCMEVLGKMVDHSSLTKNHVLDVKLARVNKMMEAYIKEYGTPNAWCWEMETQVDKVVTVKMLTGKNVKFSYKHDSTVLEFKQGLRFQEGIPVDQMRLISGGVQWVDGNKVLDYSIPDNIVHLVLKMRGC